MRGVVMLLCNASMEVTRPAASVVVGQVSSGAIGPTEAVTIRPSAPAL